MNGASNGPRYDKQWIAVEDTNTMDKTRALKICRYRAERAGKIAEMMYRRRNSILTTDCTSDLLGGTCETHGVFRFAWAGLDMANDRLSEEARAMEACMAEFGYLRESVCVANCSQ